MNDQANVVAAALDVEAIKKAARSRLKADEGR